MTPPFGLSFKGWMRSALRSELFCGWQGGQGGRRGWVFMHAILADSSSAAAGELHTPDVAGEL